MVAEHIEVYEGKEKYIFISYAHKDSPVVFPVLNQLVSRGYRIWYDDGIAPGSEWPENIAQHLNDCAMFLSFITPNSINSDNCRREITYALAKKKPFLAVVLEPTQMPLGVEFQLSAQQCIFKYNYRTEKEFINKICDCKDIECCCRSITETTEPEEEKEPQTENIGSDMTAEEKSKHHTKNSVNNRTPEQKKKHVKKIIMRVTASILAIFAVIIGLVLAWDAYDTIEIAPGRNARRGATSLVLRNVNVNNEVVTNINKLTELEILTLNDCVVDSGALNELSEDNIISDFEMTGCKYSGDYSFLSKLEYMSRLAITNGGITDKNLMFKNLAKLNRITYLDLSNNPKFTDASLISGLTNLTDLNLSETGIENLNGISVEKLTTVDLSKNPEFTDVSSISGLTNLTSLNLSETGIENLNGISAENLTTIDFSNTAVSDISALSKAAKLDCVIGNNTEVSDISPLAGLTEIKKLNFNNCKISKVTDSFKSLRMQYLYFSNNNISDLTGFENFTILEDVDFSNNKITDIAWLSKSTASLKNVNLTNNPLEKKNIEFLKNAENVAELYVDGIKLGDLEIAENMGELTRISAAGCGLTDISGLSEKYKLQYIDLSDNFVTDITPLKLSADGYLRLNLADNNLTDVSGLPLVKYSLLCLAGNKDLKLNNISGQSFSYVILDYTPELLNADLSNASRIYIVNCPDDQKVKCEEKFGSYKVRFFTDAKAALSAVI